MGWLLPRWVTLALLFLAATRPAAAEPAVTSRLHWVTNGTVRAAAVHDQTLYIGGSFTRVAPAANFLGPWFGVSTATGAALPRLPLADAAVLAIEPDGAGGYFVGGRFTQIGGVLRTGLAHVRADGSVDPAFAPALQAAFANPAGPAALDVRTLARAGATLYVGGSFRMESDGIAREGTVALDAATGGLLPAFQPPSSMRADKILVDGGRVFTLGQRFAGALLPGVPTVAATDAASGITLWTRELSSPVHDGVVAGGALIVVGEFTVSSIHARIARLDPATGAIDPGWRPIQTAYDGVLHAVTAVGTTLYVGGRFAQLNGQWRWNVAAIDSSLGTLTDWAPTVEGTVRDLAPAPGGVYLAGDFHRVSGTPREALAEIDGAGAVTAWNAQAYTVDARTLLAGAGTLLVGGAPAVAGGVARNRLAAFALDTDTVLPWAPVPPDDVLELATDGVTVFVGISPISFVSPDPDVGAFDAVTGAPSSWNAPPWTRTLLGVFDGQVYVSTSGDQATLFRGGATLRVDGTTGIVDPSWRLDVPVVRLVRGGDLVYALGATTVYGESRQIPAVHLRTGALSPWNPTVFPEPSAAYAAAALAVMGRTMSVAYATTYDDSGGLVGADTVSGLPVQFPAAVDLRVLDMATADGLVLMVGKPNPRGDVAAVAVHPDGTRAPWNPGLRLTDHAWSRYAVPRLTPTATDVILTGVQSLGPTPVHGIAVFARQAPEAPTNLDAVVIDNAVQLGWLPSEPPAASHLVEVGSVSGASNILVQPTGTSTTRFDAVAPAGTYFVRVRAAGVAPGPASAPTNEIALRVGCTSPPPPPTRVMTAVNGPTVTLTWDAPPFVVATRYVIEAGSSRGLANLARIAVRGTETSLTTDAPAGTYFVRLRSENACGASAPTPDLWLTVGGGPIPGAPANVYVFDQTPTLPVGMPHHYLVAWNLVPGAVAYVLEVGSAPGLSDLVWSVIDGAQAGPAAAAYGRTHFLRVRAIGPAGIGPPSREYVLVAR